MPARFAVPGWLGDGVAEFWPVVFGLAFGLGAALTPLLILLPLICVFGARLRENRDWLSRWIRWGAALVLILLGARRILLAW